MVSPRQSYFSNVRGSIFGIFAFLGSLNIIAWVAAIVIFHQHPLLLGTSLIAYGFGLRHAVDADHIAAIDNVTRKLMQQGQKPVGVGLAFSLGHSTIVFGLSAFIAATAAAIHGKLAPVANWAGVVGTLISGFFLFSIAMMNLWILCSVIKTFLKVRAGGAYCEEDINLLLARRGFFGRVFRGLFNLVNRPWQMYLVGLLFGLGFDTATEVGLLGIAAATAAKDLPIWSIMIFPALFTAGMTLIDSTNSVLMLGAYGWANLKPTRKLLYNISVTALSVLAAVIVGSIEMLSLVQQATKSAGWFWNKVVGLNDDTVFGVLGYGIVGLFIVAWILSFAVYKLRRSDKGEVVLAE